jgi:signal transduction histidine kinase
VHYSQLEVDVTDNGVGGATATPGSGLEGLRDRVEAVGGTFAVVSTAGLGTRVSASIPAVAAGRSRAGETGTAIARLE